jgi:hypothetical protein
VYIFVFVFRSIHDIFVVEYLKKIRYSLVYTYGEKRAFIVLNCDMKRMSS